MDIIQKLMQFIESIIKRIREMVSEFRSLNDKY